MCTVIFPKLFESSLISAIPVITFLPLGLLHPSLREKKKKENRLDIQFKFHFCQISINIGFSLDHPKCILFWWLIFHVISKQKDKTDKSSTKTCHGTRYWKKKKKGTETDPNRNTMVLLYEPSAVKKKEKSKVSKRRKESKMTNKRKVPKEMVFSLCASTYAQRIFPYEDVIARSLPIYGYM